MTRRAAGILAIVIVLMAGAGYVGWATWRHQPRAATAAVRPTEPGTILFLDAGERRVGQVPADMPTGPATLGDLRCLRLYSAGGTTVCLRAMTVPAGFEAAVFDRSLRQVTRLRIDGVPSRARVSPSGRLVTWTVFRTGDSYSTGEFSTTAGIYDLVDRTLYGSLEDFDLRIDGQVSHAADVNFWGVTFLDDRTFYVTVSTGGRTWLLRGDLATRSLDSVRENAECPAVSPDGTRVAYKKRNAAGEWRLHILELDSGIETALAESANVDDQVVWLTSDLIGYAKIPDGQDNPAIFAVPADGSGAPVLVRSDASSPAPLS